MRKWTTQRNDQHPILTARIEPTFGPVSEPAAQPGKIRIITTEEYTRAAQTVWESNKQAESAGAHNGQDFRPDQAHQSAWKKMRGTAMWLGFILINIALLYVELQPKTLKPTFSISTPWGVAEILTPWGK